MNGAIDRAADLKDDRKRGSNKRGESHSPDVAYQAYAVSGNVPYGCGLKLDGSIECWGDTTFGR
jgi:hypothetical protein